MTATPEALGAAETLAIWERVGSLGPDASSLERALLLASYDGVQPDALAQQPVGRCHALLLGLRQRAVGEELSGLAGCPGCGGQVEFSIGAADLLGPDEPGAAGDAQVLTSSGFTVHCRPPAPADLIPLAAESDPAAALWRRCVDVTNGEGDGVDPSALPAAVLEEVEEALAAADPLAELVVTIGCPDCGCAFAADLDLGSFVWGEVEARAHRILHDIDVLARAYGWTEPDVLALSEPRRAAYLRLVIDGAP